MRNSMAHQTTERQHSCNTPECMADIAARMLGDMTDDDLSKLPERVLSALRAAGMTQVELARQAGIKRASVNDWVKGRSRYIRPEHLFRAADALGVSPRWLATGRGPRIDPLRTPDVRLVAELYADAPVRIRAAVRSMLEAVADDRSADADAS